MKTQQEKTFLNGYATQIVENITSLADRKRAERFGPYLIQTMELYEINTPLRVAHFLAQVAHESGLFMYTKEIWGPTSQQLKYEPPSELAFKLGNTEKGDGHRFAGHGLIQITGRKNHTDYATYKTKQTYNYYTPEDVANLMSMSAEWATDGAGWFWVSRGLNELADQDDFLEITRRINGGFTGVQHRRFLLNQFKSFLNVS